MSTGLFLSSDVLDGGLTVFSLANKISICSTYPTSYTAASTTLALGVSTFAVGGLFGSISTSADGEQISAVAVSSANVNANGAPACWAVMDDANSRLLAYGPMTGSTDVVSGHKWSLSAFTIDMPGYTYTFPLSGASIDLQFAYQRYYGSTVTTLSSTDVLSISRASVGYVKNTNGTLTLINTNDTLRIGVGTGLLVEDARTNYLHYSQDQTQAASWPPNELTITNGFSAPDGTNTACKLLPTTVSAFHLANGTPDAMTGTTRSLSIFAKRASGTYNVQLSYTDGVSNLVGDLDLGTGAATFSAGASWSGANASAEQMADGWWRFQLNGTSSQSNTYYYSVRVTDASLSNTFVGDGTSSIYVWGAQMENATFPSSYIPTTTTSAARASDMVACIANLNTVLSLSAMTVQLEVQYPFTDYNGAFIGGDAGVSPYNYIGKGSAIQDLTKVFFENPVTGLSATLGGGKLQTDASGFKVALANSGTGRSGVAAGGTVVSDANVNNYSNSYLGSNSSGTTRFLYGFIRRVTVWNSKLADATIQANTAP